MICSPDFPPASSTKSKASTASASISPASRRAPLNGSSRELPRLRRVPSTCPNRVLIFRRAFAKMMMDPMGYLYGLFYAIPWLGAVLGTLLFALQIWMIVDCLRNGNELYWIWVILVLGPIGVLI